ncbi:MAG: DUF6492 family protein [Polynucleobacter sp.]|nr:DUF6492 family protein [Polynucleobacter sp.]
MNQENDIHSTTAQKKVDKVVSVCCKKDAETWVIAHKKVLENINASQYLLIVPDQDVHYFKLITRKPYQVISELIYLELFQDKLLKALPKQQSHQYGWYLQQFIKLAVIEKSPPNEVILVWDADTIPIQKLEFINEYCKLIYYTGNEHHQPYFDCIARLSDQKKIVDFSFISQCFPMRSEWMHEFCYYIENIHEVNWIQAILNSIDFNEGNGFSEYETLGTFLTHKHIDQIVITKRKWHRLGNSLIGHPAFLNRYISKNKVLKFDYMSFEKWDRIKLYFFKVTIPYFFTVTAPKKIVYLFRKFQEKWIT